MANKIKKKFGRAIGDKDDKFLEHTKDFTPKARFILSLLHYNTGEIIAVIIIIAVFVWIIFNLSMDCGSVHVEPTIKVNVEKQL